MLYVLEQRLGAQQVKSDKSQRVLCDVVRTMFSRRFVEELFKPQFLYKDRNVRQIFDKLAHSSIMKLNETSMGKLYSLMVMGVKFQVVRVATPCHVLDVTMEHAQILAAKPISSLIASKKLIMDPIRERIHAARKHEDNAFAELLGKPANLEALQAFAEKRDPDFSSLGE